MTLTLFLSSDLLNSRNPDFPFLSIMVGPLGTTPPAKKQDLEKTRIFELA